MIVKKKISFRVTNSGRAIDVETYENEYRNLMVLLNDQVFPENFGECGGQGRCATCAVTVKNVTNELKRRERNEDATLDKLGVETDGLRLSCQILVNTALQNAVINIIEQ